MKNDKDKIKILFVGGDARVRFAAEEFIKAGALVRFCEGACGDTAPIGAAANESITAAILPIPASRDGINLTGTDTPLADIAKALGGTLIFTRRYDAFKRSNVFDLASDRLFKAQNAIPTAEGAIAAAIEKSRSTLDRAKILVTGYGECAKALACRLAALGADVTIAARKEEARKEAQNAGFRVSDLSKEALRNALAEIDVVFNTVPALIFDAEVLNDTRELLFFELASSPSAPDEARSALGERYAFLPSLPSKCAPKSAGKILASRVLEIVGRCGK